jgi:hypothetical protein
VSERVQFLPRPPSLPLTVRNVELQLGSAIFGRWAEYNDEAANMRATGCNSFSIAISIEGIPIAVSKTGPSGEGLARVETRPLVGPLERSSSRSQTMQWHLMSNILPLWIVQCATGLDWGHEEACGQPRRHNRVPQNAAIPRDFFRCQTRTSGPVGTHRGSVVR